MMTGIDHRAGGWMDGCCCRAREPAGGTGATWPGYQLGGRPDTASGDQGVDPGTSLCLYIHRVNVARMKGQQTARTQVHMKNCRANSGRQEQYPWTSYRPTDPKTAPYSPQTASPLSLNPALTQRWSLNPFLTHRYRWTPRSPKDTCEQQPCVLWTPRSPKGISEPLLKFRETSCHLSKREGDCLPVVGFLLVSFIK